MTNRVVTYVLRGQVSDLTAKMSATSASVRKVATDMTGLDAQAEKTRRGLTAVGGAATTMGLVAAAGLGLIVKASMDWESAWAGVTKTVNGSISEMAALEEGLRGLATTLPATHREIAAVAEAAGQLGVAQEDILGFTKTMIDLAETTNLTADEAASSIAQFMNVMQTAPEDVDNLGAALVALGNDGASTERDIIQMAQNIAGAGAIVGASESDILALANALASVGIEAEAGGSSVSKILIDMSKAVATNSADLQKWASISGLSVEQFSAKFKASPVQAFDAFTKGLGRVNAEGGDVFTMLSQLGQTDIRVTRSLLGMANSGDLLADSLATGSREWERNLALTEEAEKRYDTAAARSKIAWNGVKDNAIDAGNAILPVVAQIADTVTTMTDAFGELPGPVKSSVGTFALFGAGALLAVGATAKVINVVSGARKALDDLSMSAPRAATGIGRVGKVAGLAAISLAALNAAGALIGDSGERAGVSKYAQAILDLAQGAKGAESGLNELFAVDAPLWSGALYDDITNVGEALNEVADGKGMGDRLKGFIGFDTKIAAASKSVTQLDSAFASLVTSGAIDEAATGFEAIEKMAAEQGISVERLMEIFPQYEDALAAAKIEQDKAAESTDGLGAAAQQTADDIGALKDALDKMLSPLLSQEEASNAWKESLLTLNEEVKENAKTLDDSTLAGIANQDAIRDRVELLQASAQADLDMGASAEDTAAKLDRGRDAIIDAGVAAGFGREAMKKYVDQLGLTPENIDTFVNLNGVPTAKAALASLRESLAAISGRSWFIDVILNRPKATGGAVGLGYAAGGSVVGPGTGTSDSIPATGPGGYRYALSNGEHIWTAAEVAAAGGQAAMYAMRAQVLAQRHAARFADGGAVAAIVSRSASASPVGGLLAPGARFRLVGPDLLELVDNRVESTLAKSKRFDTAQKNARR